MEFTWTIQHQSTDPIQENRNCVNDHEETTSVIGHSAVRRILAVTGKLNILKNNNHYLYFQVKI